MSDHRNTELSGGATPPPVLKLPGDRYRVLRKLGAGSMGEVHLAEDTKLRRRVAIKSIRADRTSAEPILRRIKRECLLHARIGAHPHIVTLFDLHDEGDQLHLVMEYVDGDTLDHVLDSVRKQGQHLPVADCIDIVIQCLYGLAHVHARGIIHRDIKPANVILTRDSAGRYTAKIMDFGVARQEEQDPEVTTLTQPGGRSPGTPLYMAPEQIDSVTYGPVTQASDLYAVGVLLYQMIAGRPPFLGSLTDVFNGHLNLDPRPIRLPGGTGPHPALTAVIEKALQKQSGRRFASAAEFAAQLEVVRPLAAAGGVAAQHDSESQSAGAWHASATRWAIAGVAGLALTAVAFLGLRGAPSQVAQEGAGVANVAPAAEQPASQPVEPDPENVSVERVEDLEEHDLEPVLIPPLNAPPVESPLLSARTLETPETAPAMESVPGDTADGIQIIEPVPGLESREIRDPFPQVGPAEGSTDDIVVAEAWDAPESPAGVEPEPVAAETQPVDMAQEKTPEPAAPALEVTPGQTYTVLPGDSLDLIARRFGLDKGKLAQWNRMPDPDALRAGQVLYLYERPGLAAPVPKPESRASDPKESRPKEIYRKTKAWVKKWTD